MERHCETITTGHKAEVLNDLKDGDLIRLQEILTGAFVSLSKEDVKEFIPAVIAAESADVLISRDDENKIASVMVVNVDYGAGKLRGRVDDVATHGDSLRRGHAGVLLDFALDWFRHRGVKRVSLTSRDEREPAHKLYFSRGFEIHNTNQFQLDLY